ncbi:hypothetical protein [Roseateles sp.]
MDIWWKAVGTAVSVALVIITARRAHRRLAGLVAAFPTVTAPALVWLAHDQGPTFAAAAAVATVAGCVMQAGFALGYARASRKLGPAGALGCSLAAAAGLASLTLAIGNQLAPAVLAAVAGVALGKLLLPAACGAARVVRAAPGGGLGEITLTVVASVLLSMLAASLGAHWGPVVAGLLASLPVVCGTVAVVEHMRHGPAAAGEFLHAYTSGLFGRVLFGAAFALAAPAWGAGWALLLAMVASIAAAAAAYGPARAAAPPSSRAAQRA